MAKRRAPYRPDDPGPLKLGQIFGDKYEICALIGRGGYAWVYEARHRFMGHRVAIKIVPPHDGIDPDVFRRAQAEAQIQRTLRADEGIVRVDDADITEDGLLYVIMELLKGRLARGLLQEHRRLEIEEVLRLAVQIARTLAAAHDVGVIHRDFKPENVFIVAGNKPKVLDFGVAKVDGAAWNTQRDLLLGTPIYMSPEQVLALPITEASDVYAFGIFMYEAMTGHHPVQYLLGDRPLSLQTYTRIITTEDPPPLDQFVPHAPDYVVGLVNQMIAKRPDQRFSTMRRALLAIQESLETYEAHARATGSALQTRDLSLHSVDRRSVERSVSHSHPTVLATAARERATFQALNANPASVPAVFGNVSSRRLAEAQQAANAYRTKPLGTPSASEQPQAPKPATFSSPLAPAFLSVPAPTPVSAPAPTPVSAPAPTPVSAPAPASAAVRAPAPSVSEPPPPPRTDSPAAPRAAVPSTRAVVRAISTSSPPPHRSRALAQLLLGAAALGFVLAGLGAVLQLVLARSGSQHPPAAHAEPVLISASPENQPAQQITAIEPPVADGLTEPATAQPASAKPASPTSTGQAHQAPLVPNLGTLARATRTPTSPPRPGLAVPPQPSANSVPPQPSANARAHSLLISAGRKDRRSAKQPEAAPATSPSTEPRLIDRLAEIMDRREEAKRQAGAQRAPQVLQTATAPTRRSTSTPVKR
jgi:serine/threonine-protein kinase